MRALCGSLARHILELQSFYQGGITSCRAAAASDRCLPARHGSPACAAFLAARHKAGKASPYTANPGMVRAMKVMEARRKQMNKTVNPLEGPRMVLGYWDDSCSDMPWASLPQLRWLLTGTNRKKLLHEYLRSASAKQQMVKVLQQSEDTVQQHCRDVFVELKKHVLSQGEVSTTLMTETCASAVEAAQEAGKEPVPTWRLCSEVPKSAVRILQWRITASDASMKMCWCQVTAQFRIEEELDPEASSGQEQANTAQKRKDEPVWVFTRMHPPPANAPPTLFGGWRLMARLQDAGVPAGRGAEVEAQIPGGDKRKRMAEAWEAQVYAMKTQNSGISGMVAKALL